MNDSIFLWAFDYKIHSSLEKKILIKKILKPDVTVKIISKY